MITTPTNVKQVRASRLEAAVLDWAGTTVDFGSRAPIVAILSAFEQAGVPVTEDEARRPMGRAKRDHLRDLLFGSGVAQRWTEAQGAAPQESDVDAIYERFLTSQAGCIVECSAVIPGCPEAISACREMGLKIGSSTGYSTQQLDLVAERAKREGYEPDVRLSADDISPGRPAPWLIMENARRMNVFPLSAVVKVDDTPAGVAAGRNAGAWSVGVVASGNEVGLTAEALAKTDDGRRNELFGAAQARLTEAGAHYLIDTIEDLPAVVAQINERLAAGEAP